MVEGLFRVETTGFYVNGADASRTRDLLNAIQTLSQLSYGPKVSWQSRSERGDRQSAANLSIAIASVKGTGRRFYSVR